MFYYASLMFIIYPIGIPTALLVMMSQFRSELHTPSSLNEESAIKLREDNQLFKREPITTFARIYRPRFWW